MEYVNRAHFRSHTLNIFIRNTEVLLAALHELRDPEGHVRSLAQEDNGKQTLRDMTCLIHNFLAGAMTVVDHTRVFVDDYYIGTEVNKFFREAIKTTFTENQLTRFIQDLRNYMIHRGPVPVIRKFSLEPSDGGKPGQFTASTGFYLTKQDLLKWSGWKSDSRKYLVSAKAEIDVLVLVESYKEIIYDFHEKFDQAILGYHKDDLVALEKMKAAFNQDGDDPSKP